MRQYQNMGHSSRQLVYTLKGVTASLKSEDCPRIRHEYLGYPDWIIVGKKRKALQKTCEIIRNI